MNISCGKRSSSFHTQQSHYGLIRRIGIDAYILTHTFYIANVCHIDADNLIFGLNEQ